MKKIYTLLTAVSLGAAAIGQSTIYVDIDATGSNDGSSWSNAYTALQDAINNATAGDEIWISEGTYYPTEDATGSTTPSSENQKQFRWDAKDLKIYGGFDGTETSLSERDWENNAVVLSGDVGVIGDQSDNCNTVLYLNGLGQTSILNGVTITKAQSSLLQQGGIEGHSLAGFTFENVELSYNQCTNKGGSYIGGSEVYLINCEFHHNTATEGGTFYLSGVNLHIEACIFHHNSSTQHSGNITFNGGNGGPIIGHTTILNSLFHNNTAGTIAGGGLFFYNVPQGAQIVNCTFANNEAPNGCAIGSNGVGMEIRNSVFYGLHSATEIYESNGNPSIIDVQNSLVEDGYSTGTNILTTYPAFTDSANYDFTVLSSSPAIDAGDTTSLSTVIPLTDLSGSVRYNGSIDLGCYESATSSVTVEEYHNTMITAYPNPFIDVIRISESGPVKVYNLQGQLVYQHTASTNQINLEHLKAGVYFLFVHTSNGTVSTKIIKD
jgi:hypothetical protein